MTSDPVQERYCAGCGSRKSACPCWGAGAGDEAALARYGLSIDQAALVDFMRVSMLHGAAPLGALTTAMAIEFASGDSTGMERLRTAWRVFRCRG